MHDDSQPEVESRVVVVGASAGGVPALRAMVSGLPATFSAPLFVVLHMASSARSALPAILSRSGPLRAVHPRDGDRILASHIYVAPPDHHLLVEGNRIGVKKGPRENRFRPSIDALFRSAAYTYGTRAIGVILSGALDDGTSGLWTLKRFGGTSVIQDPEDAEQDAMPINARTEVVIDHTLAARDIGALLVRLCEEAPVEQQEVLPELRRQVEIEVAVASTSNAFKQGIMDVAELTPFTCPECHGALVTLRDGSRARFRCHTGHSYTKSALLDGVTDAVDVGLWEVTRALEECVMLLDAMAVDLKEAGKPEEADRVSRKARQTEERARALQEIAVKHEHLSEEMLRDTPTKMRG